MAAADRGRCPRSCTTVGCTPTRCRSCTGSRACCWRPRSCCSSTGSSRSRADPDAYAAARRHASARRSHGSCCWARIACLLLSPAEWHPAPVLRFRVLGFELPSRARARSRSAIGCVLLTAARGRRAVVAARWHVVSLRSPLGRVIGLGSAKSGSGHWYSQRVTAVARGRTGSLVHRRAGVARQPRVHGESRSGWSRPLNAALCALLLIACAQHAWLGLQVVIEDYVGGKVARLVLLVAIEVRLHPRRG